MSTTSDPFSLRSRFQFTPPREGEREDLEDAPFWQEVHAFNQMPQTQIDEFYGQYVAVYGGNIVDADPDEGELALRFYRTFGYVPVYIHKVGTEEGMIDPADL